MTCYLNEMIKRTATLAAGGFSVLNSAPTHPEFFFFFYERRKIESDLPQPTYNNQV